MVWPTHLSTTRHTPGGLDSSEESDSPQSSRSPSSPHSPGSIVFRDFSLAPLNVESTTTPADPFPSHPLLQINELHINPGEWVVVSGQSGAGKSLFLNSIIDAGIRSSVRSAQHRHSHHAGIQTTGYCSVSGTLGFCAQNSSTSLDPLTPVRTQISYALPKESGGEAIDHADALLDRVRVDGSSYPLELSGGQRQRACLILALIHQPNVLIADEVTSALDPVTSLAIRDMLREFYDAYHPTIIMVTHDVAGFVPLATRHLHINDGVLVDHTDGEGKTTAPFSSTPEHGDNAHFDVLSRSAESHGHGRSHMPIVSSARRSSELSGSPRVSLHDATCEGRFHHCSCDLYAGEKVGFVGRSGSGKTSLLRAIMGSLPLNDGNRTAPDHRGWCAFVPQQPDTTLHPLMTVQSIMREATLIAGVEAPDYEKLVESLGLPADVLYRRPHQLSGGQRQRVALARALSTRPSVVLADEIVSALDAESATTTMSVLSTYQQQTSCAVAVTGHDFRFMVSTCDRILVLDDGRIVDNQTATEIGKSRVPQTAELIHADRVFRGGE